MADGNRTRREVLLGIGAIGGGAGALGFAGSDDATAADEGVDVDAVSDGDVMSATLPTGEELRAGRLSGSATRRAADAAVASADVRGLVDDVGAVDVGAAVGVALSIAGVGGVMLAAPLAESGTGIAWTSFPGLSGVDADAFAATAPAGLEFAVGGNAVLLQTGGWGQSYCDFTHDTSNDRRVVYNPEEGEDLVATTMGGAVGTATTSAAGAWWTGGGVVPAAAGGYVVGALGGFVTGMFTTDLCTTPEEYREQQRHQDRLDDAFGTDPNNGGSSSDPDNGGSQEDGDGSERSVAGPAAGAGWT